MCGYVNAQVSDIVIFGKGIEYIEIAHFTIFGIAPFYSGLKFERIFSDFFISNFIIILSALFVYIYLYMINLVGNVDAYESHKFVIGTHARIEIISMTSKILTYFTFGLFANRIIKNKFLIISKNTFYNYILLLIFLLILIFNYKIGLIGEITTRSRGDCSIIYELGWINKLISTTNTPIFLFCFVLIILFSFRALRKRNI